MTRTLGAVVTALPAVALWLLPAWIAMFVAVPAVKVTLAGVPIADPPMVPVTLAVSAVVAEVNVAVYWPLLV